jgi:hypothetical protein
VLLSTEEGIESESERAENHVVGSLCLFHEGGPQMAGYGDLEARRSQTMTDALYGRAVRVSWPKP